MLRLAVLHLLAMDRKHMATIRGKRVLTSLYLDPPVAEELKRLSAATRVPQAVYLREAVDLLLAHYRRVADGIAGRPLKTLPRPPVLARFIRGADRRKRK